MTPTAGIQGDFAEDRSREQRVAQAADAFAARFLLLFLSLHGDRLSPAGKRHVRFRRYVGRI
ncbi:hypothetical protein EMEDMD4_1280048 [Sinorhizobium medicae]|uniref:Uncharacterized protein n=1 Tax=Sinorhizobium medicae TaxID=110321 RepID=A0A508WW40_9HYPH|nr:hypothetical protein EMEDMD4_1280048 [Sinorhizobium medicae]